MNLFPKMFFSKGCGLGVFSAGSFLVFFGWEVLVMTSFCVYIYFSFIVLLPIGLSGILDFGH